MTTFIGSLGATQHQSTNRRLQPKAYARHSWRYILLTVCHELATWGWQHIKLEADGASELWGEFLWQRRGA